MSLDITSLAIKVTSEGIDQATKSLSDLASAANKLEKDVPGVKAVMSAMAASQKSSADAAEALIAKLQKQVDTLGMNKSQLASYNSALKGATEAQIETARSLGAQVDAFNAAAKAAKDHEAAVRKASSAHSEMRLLTAGSTRELLVLGHELSQGNFQRFSGSLIVMAERINFLPKLLAAAGEAASSMGVSVGTLFGGVLALVGAVALVTYEFIKGITELNAFNRAMVLTGGYAGQTRESLEAMAQGLKSHAHEAIGTTTTMLQALVATGKFSSDSLRSVAAAALDFQRLTGKSTQEVVSYFEGLVKFHGKLFNDMNNNTADWAAKANESYHFLSAAQYEHIRLLAQEGNQTEAVNEVTGLLSKSLSDQGDKIGVLVGIYRGWVIILQEAAHWLKEVGKDWFSGASTSDSLAKESARLEQLMKEKRQAKFGGQLDGHGENLPANDTRYAALTKAVADQLAKVRALEKQDNDERAVTTAKADLARINELGVQSQREWDSLKSRNRTKGQIADDNIAKIKNDAANINASNIATWQSTYQGEKSAMAAEQALAVTNGQLKILTEKDINAQIELEKKRHHDKVDKPTADGLAAMNAAIHKAQEEFDSEMYFADRGIKLAKEANKAKEMSAQELYDTEMKLQGDRQILITKGLNAELAATQLYDHTSKDRVKLSEEAAAKRYEIQQRFDKLMFGSTTAEIEAKEALRRAGDAGEKAADKAFVRDTQNIAKKTELIQDQINGYNLIPEAIRNAGLSQKQMQDYFTQAEIDGVNSQIAALQEFDGVSSVLTAAEITRLKARAKALEDLKNVQTAWEKIGSTNTDNLALPARLKAEAAAQAEIWKSTGNEIEKALVNAFSKAGKAAGEMFKLYDEGQAKQIQITQKIVEAEDRKAHGVVTAQKTIDDLKSQSAMVEIATYANMVGAAKNYFASSSDGYRAMAAAEKILTIISVAESAKRLYAAAMANIPLTITIAAVAGLAAIFGGGKQGPNIAEIQKLQSTGSVLGSNDAKSDSIAKSLTTLEKNSGLGLAQGSDMVGYLKTVSDNIVNLSSLIVRSTGITGKTAADTKASYNTASTAVIGIAGGVIGIALDKLTGGFVSKVVGGVLGTLFGGKTSVTDTGFTAGSTTLGGVSSSGFNASQYTDVTKSGGLFGRDKSSTSVSSLGADANDQFSKIIIGMASAITSASNLIGIGGDAFTKHLNEFVIDIGKISLKGLTGDQIQKELEAVFSKIGDDMAKFAFAGLAKFQKVGEGYFETVSRTANDLVQVKDVFAVLGKSMIATGLEAVEISEQLITAAGGLDKLTKGTKYFVDNFLTDAEKIAPIAVSVDKRLSELGQSNIKTIDQYKALVRAQDLNTIGGQTLYAALLDLAPAFKAVSDEADKAVTAALDIAKKKRELEIQLLEAQGKAEEALAARRTDELAALTKLDPVLAALQQQIYDASAASTTLSTIQKVFTDNLATAKTNLQAAYQRESTALQGVIDKFKAFSESLKKFKDSLLTGDLSTLSPEQKYLQAKLKFQSTSALAATGNEAAIGELQNVSQEFLNASRGYNASTEAYAKDFDLVQKGLSEGAIAADAQVSIAQSQLSIMTAQYNSLLGIQAGVLSFKDALAAYTGASANAKAAGISVPSGSASGAFFGPAEIEASLKAVQAAAGLPVTGLYVANTASALIDGSHAGGLDRVPRDGYIAKLHAGERVQTAARASASDENSAKVVALTQELIAKVSKVEEAIAAGNNQRGAIHTEQVEVLGEVKDGIDKVKRAVVAK